ncbi:hypothetical protein QVD17_10480 [Tagetes erecta]|uniref:Peptidyl-prolyl cis-trans isomerase n=1 Tax=Tagetes erecta TaxID=13708 RepID=A0AAD8L3E7_TARER|nr:hypothetical protein QVD17_10480 [Tagetes erecta]
MMESDKPQSSSVRKEEPEPKLQKDNYPNKYESSFEKLEATCLPATKGKDREVKPSANPNQLSGDPGEEMSNPRVYLDVSINEGPPERMVIELFADVEPRIAENFRAICVGSVSATGKFLHYKGRVFSTIFKGFYAQGGVSENQDDTGDESIYGRSFPDEDCEMKYSGPGILMMASNRPNVIGSRFILTFRYKRCVFGRVFGKVIKGMETVQNIEQAGRFGRVRITGCGEIADGKEIKNCRYSQSPLGANISGNLEYLIFV